MNETLDDVLRRVLWKVINEGHRNRTGGRDASPGWIKNSMGIIESDPIWQRVFEVLREESEK